MKPKEEFIKKGYVIYPNLISSELIDKFLESFANFKERNLLFYSQSEHNWRRVKNELDENNLLISSFENFTNLVWAGKMSHYGRNILQSNVILEKLQELSEYNNFVMWQNMLFDKSTGTVDHIDSWYLDTNPFGDLIAAWVALEDIDGRGGSFHVYPKSHLDPDQNWRNINSHDDFVSWSNNLSTKYKKKEALLKKGDVLFWHPLLIHGATNQKTIGNSRKSLTAHYYPKSLLQGRRGAKSNPKSKDYKRKLQLRNKKIRYFNNHPIASNVSRKRCISWSIKGALKYFLTSNKTFDLMNRKNYNFLK